MLLSHFSNPGIRTQVTFWRYDWESKWPGPWALFSSLTFGTLSLHYFARLLPLLIYLTLPPWFIVSWTYHRRKHLTEEVRMHGAKHSFNRTEQHMPQNEGDWSGSWRCSLCTWKKRKSKGYQSRSSTVYLFKTREHPPGLGIPWQTPLANAVFIHIHRMHPHYTEI